MSFLGRFLLALYLVFFAAALVGVLALNLERKDSFTYWPGRTLSEVPQVFLVWGAIFAGAGYVFILALLEETRLQLRIRKLERKLASVERERFRAREPVEPAPRALPSAPGSGDRPRSGPVAKASFAGEDEAPWNH